MKKCSHCKLELAVTQFYQNRTKRDGLASICKACSNLLRNAYMRTPDGKLSQIVSSHKYYQSPKGKAAYTRFNRSTNGTLRDKRRRERKRSIDLVLSFEDISSIRNAFNHTCFNCGSHHRLEIDHHRPLVLGHGLSIHNAVLLCRSCNASKGTKIPEQFYDAKKLEALRGYGII